MTEFLPSMSGPVFLVLYLILFLVCLIVGRILTRFDGSKGYPMPEPTHFSPREVAAFAGGAAEVLRTILFSLTERKILVIKGEGETTRIKRYKKKKSESPDDPMDALVVEAVKTPQTPRDLFSNQALMDGIESNLTTFYGECEKLRLHLRGEDRLWHWIVTLTTMAVVGGVGGLRLVHGINNDKPLGLLVLFMVLYVVMLRYFLRPRPRTKSYLGRQYLARLYDHFDWLKDEMVAGKPPEGFDPALPLALYGPGVFAGITSYALFSAAFTPEAFSGLSSAHHSGTGGGCGVGCGSGDTGDGGGCGSGCSGCGGGCGGCS